MRTLPGLLLALGLLLTGCGSESPADEQADGPTPGASTSASPGDADHTVLALVSESDVGGEVDPRAVPLDTPQRTADFASRFEDQRMEESISRAIAGASVPEGQVVLGAVVAVGCEPPTEVSVEVGPDRVEITAAPVKSTQQCLVPVTTVALVAVAAVEG